VSIGIIFNRLEGNEEDGFMASNSIVFARLRSVGAVLAGLVAVAVLSIVGDQVFHSLGVYPPWGEPMLDTGHNLIAISYRIVFTVLGGYIAARLAPSSPMGHALALGVIGTILGALGAIGAWEMEMSPPWFLIAIVVTALPCAWLGAKLHGG